MFTTCGGHRALRAPSCELCAQLIAERHRHVVDLADRRIACACSSCAILFSDAASRRYRAVPSRVRAPRGWTLTPRDLDALGIPVGLAFFFRSSKLGRWIAVLPSPVGPTEAELRDGAVEALERGLDARGKAFLSSIEDDVEALLVRRRRDGCCVCFIVPIDAGYELTALLRRAWRGVSGGEEATRALDAFFERLAERAEPAAVDARFERARTIADAILLEGYVLYPYRSDATKNRYRWTFGVLAPRAWSESGGCEPWWQSAEVLVESSAPRARGRLRFLRVVERRIEVRGGDGRFRCVDALEVDGRRRLPWQEGELREIDFGVAHEPGFGDVLVPFSVPASEDVEDIEDASGALVGRIVRTRAAVHGALRVHVEPVGAAALPLSRMTIRIENLTPCSSSLPRADVMRFSCVSTHVLLASDGGPFVSLFDPPAHAARAAAYSESVGTYPVLAGEAGSRDLVLCSPIILEDHPRIAPESPGDLFDAGHRAGVDHRSPAHRGRSDAS